MYCSGGYQAVYSWWLVDTAPHSKGKRQEDELCIKEAQIAENNRNLISNSMTLNELCEHYVRMQTKRKKIKRRISENYVGFGTRIFIIYP